MAKARFDERCPHCAAKTDVYAIFISKNRDEHFNFKCNVCNKPINCDVELVPEFDLWSEDDEG